jgi:anti-sigma B factor antagonist
MAGGGGQIQVVQVRGELDLALADSLAARGYAAIGRQARVLLLDVAGVSFCDARGLSALVRIANHADRTGCRYGLIAPQPLVVRILRITGLDQRLPVFTSVNEAAIALGYDTQTPQEEPDDQWPATSQLDTPRQAQRQEHPQRRPRKKGSHDSW